MIFKTSLSTLSRFLINTLKLVYLSVNNVNITVNNVDILAKYI